MMRSMYSAVSGLKTHQTRMDVIGNNIANVNTVAFKSSSVTFSDILYQTTSNASGANATTRHHVRKQPPVQKDRRGSFRFGTPPDFHAVHSPAVLNNVRGCRYVSYFPGSCPLRRPLYSSLAEPSYGRPLSRFFQYFCSLSASLPPVCRDF